MNKFKFFALCFSWIFCLALSANGGWEPMPSPTVLDGHISALGCDGGGTVYASHANAGGIYRSTDDGLHWEKVGLHAQSIHRFLFTENAVFAMNFHGLWRSQDRGRTWQAMADWPSDSQLAIHEQSLFRLDRGNDSITLRRSDDDGNTWSEIGLPSECNGPGYCSLSSCETFLFLAGQKKLPDGSDAIRLFRSEDGGQHWSAVGKHLPGDAMVREILSNGSALLANVWSRKGPSGTFRSLDDGATWCHAGLEEPRLMAVMEDSFFWAGYAPEPKILRSDDGGQTWIPVNSNLISKEITAMATDGDQVFVGLEGKGISRSDSLGEQWTVLNHGLERKAHIQKLFTLGGQLYAFPATSTPGLYRSKDTGEAWVDCTLGGPFDRALSVAVDTRSNTIIANTEKGLFRYDPVQELWTYAGLSPDHYQLFCHGGTLFTGDPNIHRSTDGGATWQQVLEVHPSVELKEFTSSGSNTLYVTGDNDWYSNSPYRNDLYRSLDNGITWQVIPLPGLPTWNHAAAGEKHVFLGNPKGVFRSPDQGLQWTQVFSLKAGDAIESIHCHPNRAVQKPPCVAASASCVPGKESDAPRYGISWKADDAEWRAAGHAPLGWDGGSALDMEPPCQRALSSACSPGAPSATCEGFWTAWTLLAGTRSGKVLTSRDQGDTWETHSLLPEGRVTSITANHDFCYAATKHDGIWKMRWDEAGL